MRNLGRKFFLLLVGISILISTLPSFASIPTVPDHETCLTAPEDIVSLAADKAKIVVFITRTGAKYHRGGCQYLRRSRIPISLKDAINNGYTPCSVCRPPQ